MSIKLENINFEDLDEVKELFFQNEKNVCSNDYSEAQRKVWSASIENKQRWLEAVNEQYFIIAKLETVIVGFGSLKEDNYIDFLYVHKDYQRHGIGTLIFEKLETQAKHKNQKLLFSEVSITAKPFFENKGFKIIKKQLILRQQIELINYKMGKQL